MSIERGIIQWKFADQEAVQTVVLNDRLFSEGISATSSSSSRTPGPLSSPTQWCYSAASSSSSLVASLPVQTSLLHLPGDAEGHHDGKPGVSDCYIY